MKKILVPTDFSDQAENALKVAVQLAQKFNSEIYLMHMLELPMQEPDLLNVPTGLPDALFFVKLAKKRFQDLLARPYLEGIKVHEIVKSYPTFSSVIDVAHEQGADLIVMGSHGTSGMMEMFVGSNAEKVVRTSDLPVLVIKSEHAEFSIDRFVFASDFKMDNKQTYRQAIQLAEMFGAHLHLLMVNTPNSFLSTAKANKRIKDFIAGYDFKNYTIHIYNDDTVEQGVLNFAHEIDADLIGISTHGRQGIAHFFNGSIGEDVVNHSKRPVITFKI